MATVEWILLADNVRLNGLKMNIEGAGWYYLLAPTFPHEPISFAVVFGAGISRASAMTPREISVDVVDSGGNSILTERPDMADAWFTLESGNGGMKPIKKPVFSYTMQPVVFPAAGTYLVHVRFNGGLVASIQLEARVSVDGAFTTIPA